MSLRPKSCPDGPPWVEIAEDTQALSFIYSKPELGIGRESILKLPNLFAL
jgi:hypothetical protein